VTDELAFPADLLTTPEAAAALRLTKKTLENWRAAGRGPRYFRCGKRSIRYARRDLAEFLLVDSAMERAA
jgi:predicted DNA-binding transcriptional regulator AlpA